MKSIEPYLRDAEIAEILQQQGWDEQLSWRAAAQSGGRLANALNYRERETSKGPVLAILRSVATRDPELLRNALIKWDEDNTAMLRQWLIEARSSRWRVFTPEESLRVSTTVLDRLETALGSGARARLVIHYALDPLTGDF